MWKSSFARWIVLGGAVATIVAFSPATEEAQAQHGARLRQGLHRVVHFRGVRPQMGPQMGPSVAPPEAMMGGYGAPGFGGPGPAYGAPAQGYGPPAPGYGQAYYPGAAAPQTAYPYYTTKGPNDYFYNGQ